jgi:hypothetical protein
MKNIIKIGLTDCIGSLLPILTWYALGSLKDSRFANVFILTYSFQFIWQLIAKVCIVSNVKYEKKLKEQDHSISLTTSIIGLILLVIVVCIFWNNMESIMIYYGVTDEEYKYFSLFGLVLLTLDYVQFNIKYLLQLNENNKGAALVCYSYYILRLLFIILLVALGFSSNQLMILTVLFCTGMLIVISIINKDLFKGFRPKFRIVESIKMSYSSIASNISMFLIYSLGLGTLKGSIAFLTAYNTMSMATDTQWDILYSAVDTNTSLSTLKGTYDSKKSKITKDSIIYSILLFISSLIALAIICLTLNTDYKLAYIFFLMECITFPLYAIKYSHIAWIECTNPTNKAFFLTASVYVVRIVTMIVVNNQYSLSLGVLIAALYDSTVYLIYYINERKKHEININNKASFSEK